MTTSLRLVGAAVLALFACQSALAQSFTILPRTDLSSADCEQILAQYEVDGVVPSVAKITAEAAVVASNTYSESWDVAYDVTCREAPEKQINPAGCEQYQKNQDELKKKKDEAEKKAESNKNNNSIDLNERDKLLGCAIKTGRISLQMAPFFVTYVANFLLAMVGIIVILFIVIGGYFYIYGGLVDQKEKGKKTIIHALMGMGLALLAWAAVSAIITAVTS